MTNTLSVVSTNSAPEALGPYSQAIRAGNLVFISGQIPLLPQSMELIEGGIEDQTRQVFRNLLAVIDAAGGNGKSIARLTIYMTDLAEFSKVNEIMRETLEQQGCSAFPARATVEVSALPKGAQIEIDAILAL